MMKKVSISVLSLAFLFSCLTSFSQNNRITDDNSKMDWWKDARFGMFIHWGLYSVPAGTYNGKKVRWIGEWIMNTGKIPVAVYKDYASQFNPVKYNAEEWVKLAKEAGMKYMILTSKHHEGFAMFKSEDPFNIVDATPFKRDVVKELAAACKKYDMKLGLYYSQCQDWTAPGGAAYNGHWDSAQNGDMGKYIDSKVVPQLKEILSNYGEISVLWFDTPEGMKKEYADKIMAVVKQYPNLIYNNRLGGGYGGDLETPEQYIPATGFPGKNWESCMTMNDTWGFKSDDNNWKNSKVLVQNLIDVASKGGNYLLNVGPTSEGLIPQPSVERLKTVGAWIKTNGEAIYGTTASPFTYLNFGRCTMKKDKMYLHVLKWPKNGIIKVPMNNKILHSFLLAKPKTKINIKQVGKYLELQLPEKPIDTIATVIKLQVVGLPNVTVTDPIPSMNKAATASSTKNDTYKALQYLMLIQKRVGWQQIKKRQLGLPLIWVNLQV